MSPGLATVPIPEEHETRDPVQIVLRPEYFLFGTGGPGRDERIGPGNFRLGCAQEPIGTLGNMAGIRERESGRSRKSQISAEGAPAVRNNSR